MLINTIIKIPSNASSTIILLEPFKYTRIQNHHDTEIWMIKDGEGLIYSNGVEIAVLKDTMIKFEPFEEHRLINIGKTTLSLVSFWYVDKKDIKNAIKNRIDKNKKYIVSCAYPTPNGTLHLGHLFGPYIISDIINRFLKLSDKSSFFASGTYGFTNHIEKTSQLSYKNTVEKFEKSIFNSFDQLNFDFDYLLNHFPTHNLFQNSLNVFKDCILKNKLIKEKYVLNPFYENDQIFLDESFVEGNCPNCGSLTIAIECENCGMMQDVAKIINPVHSITKEVLSKRKVKKLYLDFDEDYINKLKLRLFSEQNEVFSFLIIQVETYIKNNQFKDIPISVFKNNGTIIYGEQKLSIVAERALRFFDVIRACDSYDKFLFFCGIDNIFISAIASPYILKIMGINEDKLPICIVNNYTFLNGKKFSTSRNNAIWLKDIKNYNSNLIRLFYAKIKNFRSISFDFECFQQFCVSVLNNWENIFDSLGKMLDDINTSKLEAGNWDLQDINFFNYCSNIKDMTYKEYESFSIEKVYINYMSLNTYLISYMSNIDDMEKYDKHSYRTKVFLSIIVCKELFKLIYPITPSVSIRILNYLGSNTIKNNINDLLAISISKIKIKSLILYIKKMQNV